MSAETTIIAVINFISKAQKREKLFNFFKYILCFFLPIGYITNEIYVIHYGAYKLDLSNWLQMIEDYPGRHIYGFIIFGVIFCVAFILEKYLLPIIGIFSSNYSKKHVNEFHQLTNNEFKKMLRLLGTKQERKQIQKEIEVDKFKFLAFISFAPVCFFLFVTCLSLSTSMFFMLLIIPIVIFYWWLLKIMNTVLSAISY
jgi:hypothetical protein